MCACGRMAVKTLSVRYRYLRAEPLPDAMDPHYVLGGGYRVSLCGNPFCERRAFVTCREEIIDHFVLNPRPGLPSGLSAEQMAGLEMEVFAA